MPTTCGGASLGGMAMPCTSFACPAGARYAVPPLVAVGVYAAAAVVERPAIRNAASASRHVCSTRLDILFRTPAGLADGLALKELARSPRKESSPQHWVPRSGLCRIRRGSAP